MEKKRPSIDRQSLSAYLDQDWQRLHEFGGVIAPKRTFSSNFSARFVHIVLIRIAQRFYTARCYRLARLFSLLNVVLFGLEVPARLAIGPGLVIPHTFGTIIGAASIGRNATIFHQVTLGATLADFAYTIELRPKIGDDVTITAGAKILGSVTIGNGAIIGANAVVLTDVPAGSLAVGVPAIIKSLKSVSNRNQISKSKSQALSD